MGPVADSANPDRILSCQNHAPPPVPPPLSSKSCGFPRYQSNARRIGAEQEASLEETEALRPTEAFPIFLLLYGQLPSSVIFLYFWSCGFVLRGLDTRSPNDGSVGRDGEAGAEPRQSGND